MDNPQRTVLFDQDRLAAYNLGRAFTRETERLLLRLPRGNTTHRDQLRRACLSITLNTAEGAGEFRPKEKARFYRMARRSGTESGAVLDSLVDRAVLEEADIQCARKLLHRVLGALTKLILSCEAAKSPESNFLRR